MHIQQLSFTYGVMLVSSCAWLGCSGGSGTAVQCADGSVCTKPDAGSFASDARAGDGASGSGSLTGGSGNGTSGSGSSGTGSSDTGSSGTGSSGTGSSGTGGTGTGGGAAGGGAGESAWTCTMNAACPHTASSTLHFTYDCTGYCTGSGTITFQPAADFECRVTSDNIHGKVLTAAQWDPQGTDVGQLFTQFYGYVGGGAIPFEANQNNLCENNNPADKNLAFDDKDFQGRTAMMYVDVKLDCPDSQQQEKAFVGGAMTSWACTECPYTENGAYFAAFNVGFSFAGDAVYDSDVSTGWGTTTCTIHGAASLGGCVNAPACRVP